MLSSRMLNNKLGEKILRHVNGRSFASQESKLTAEKPIESVNPSVSTPTGSLAKQIAPTNFDKKILVWVKQYPSADKVPERITLIALNTARSKARVKFCNWMILFFSLGFLGTAIAGRKAVSEGDTVLERGMELVKQAKESSK